MNNFMSMKATCLLLKMLGKPDNWDYTISGMKTFCKEGRDAIRSALKELEYFGYLERRKVRDARGRYTDIEYIIYEVPISPPPRSAYPESENPSLENPFSENPTVINKEMNKNRKNKKQTQQSIDSVPSPPSRSEMNEATESVREQIEYDIMIGEDGYDSELVDEAVAQMVEAICSTKSSIRVAGENRSAFTALGAEPIPRRVCARLYAGEHDRDSQHPRLSAHGAVQCAVFYGQLLRRQSPARPEGR